MRVSIQPAEILPVAGHAGVMFVFTTGPEMQLSRLWRMRREIFGPGLVQVFSCILLLYQGGHRHA